MEECIFCKIAAGEIPCAKVYENESVVAFLDIMPAAPGHTLVVPKAHSANITDIDPVDLHEVIASAQEIAPKIMKAMEADGFNIGMNNFPAAGQAVMHTHLHIIPRKKGDGLKMWAQRSYAEGEMDAVLRKITGTG